MFEDDGLDWTTLDLEDCFPDSLLDTTSAPSFWDSAPLTSREVSRKESDVEKKEVDLEDGVSAEKIIEPFVPEISSSEMQSLSITRQLCDLFNSGDLEGLTKFIDDNFAKDCLVKTPAIDHPVKGSQFVFKFFDDLLVGHPDGFLLFERSSFDRRKNVISRITFSGTEVRKNHRQQSFLLANPADCRTLGWISKQIIDGTRRYFFASERQKLEKMERKVIAGRGHARLEICVVTQLVLSRKAGSKKVEQFILKWKFKEFTVVPTDPS